MSQQGPYPPPHRPQQPPPGWVHGAQPYRPPNQTPQGPPPQGPHPQGPPPQGPHPQGPPPQGPPPGHFTTPRPEHRADRGRRRLLDPMALLAVLTLAIGLVLGWFAGRHNAQPDTLDPHKVEAGVTRILQDDYGVPNVSGMACPDGMRVQKDATYTCTFTAGSTKGSVDIIVRNDAGQYQVQGPRG